MKTIKKNLRGMAIIGGLIALLGFVHAQETATLVQSGAVSLDDPSVDWASLSDVEVELKAIEATTPVPADALPFAGTFISAQHALDWPPLPGNIRNLPCWPLDTNLFLLSDLAINYSAKPKATRQTTAMAGNMMAMDLPAPGDGEDGGTNSYVPCGSGITVDYGTNLWIANFALTPSNAVGMLSNSLVDVMYEIQVRQSLTSTDDWTSAGFVYGSEVTNWTALAMANVSLTNNAFFRIRSWQDDGSGLPIWWQMQYFGTTGVDPYGNPAGDGWNNLQKFQNGMNPSLFYTPAAPQLNVSYNAFNGIAAVSWAPLLTPATGYTIKRFDGYLTIIDTNVFNLPGNTSSLQDSVPVWAANVGGWGGFYSYYQIQAHYAVGDSAWSDPVYVRPDAYAAVSIIPGPQGSACLAVASLPAGTTALRLARFDPSAEDQGNYSFDTYIDIPVSASTNGLYLLPASITTSPMDVYGNAEYRWAVQIVNIAGATNAFGSEYTGYSTSAGYFGLEPPYHDGRVQLKQNLIFLLRAATADYPFYFQEHKGGYFYQIANPVEYAYSAFNNPYAADGYLETGFDVFSPFINNHVYRNFVFNLADTDSGGHIATGVGGSYTDPNDNGLTLQDPATYQFQTPTTNGTAVPALLATNQTQWLCSYPLDSPLIFDPPSPTLDGYMDEFGVTVQLDWDQWIFTYTMAGGARNVYGLPFLSAKIAWGNVNDTTTTLAAGSSTTQGDVRYCLYPETAQPQLQTVEYDFWNRSSLPGMTNFSMSQASDLLIAGIGNSIGVNGYAKLAVINGYAGVYGYLGQYFDQAYKEDANRIATMTTTGVLSPYGSFFATEPGPAALVTMPDVDTGARGTCTVYCVSLQLDRNHDGTMDLSFNGPDATSQASPMVWWINNDCD